MSERKINLGKLEGVPEVRIHHWHTEHRHTWHVAYAIVNADISDDAWNSVQNCAIAAGAGAILASIFSVGAGAYPAFWAAFSACVAAAGINLATESVRLTVETEHGDWHDWTPI